MLPPVLERLPMLDVVRCYFEPDGTFPNHEPNPLLPENREFIVAKTREERADFGVAFDGDADRCFFVDDTGEFVPGDFITALFAETILAQGARRQGDLRRARVVGGPGGDRARRRRAARQPRRPRVHQAAHARGGRRLRRRGLGALLLPRLLAGGLRHGPVPADVRARVAPRQAERGAARRSASATSSRARSTRRSPTSQRSSRSSKERFGPEGKVSHLDGLSVEATTGTSTSARRTPSRSCA